MPTPRLLPEERLQAAACPEHLLDSRETSGPGVFQSTPTVPPPAQVLMTAWITKALVKRKEQSASTTVQTGWAFAHTSEKERITEIVAKTYRCKQLPEHL